MPNRVLIGAFIALHTVCGTRESHSVLSFAGPSTNSQEQTLTADQRAKERADSLVKSGRELRDRAKGKDDYEAAELKFREAAQIYKSLTDDAGEAETLLLLAATLKGRDLNRESLPVLERALLLAQNLGDQRREARALTAAGEAYYWVQSYEAALNYRVFRKICG